ncbi:Early nodulin protein 2 [Spatholobus suberectus]|nr:Early nodulin protein 2 [Spatholobus suberectus]
MAAETGQTPHRFLGLLILMIPMLLLSSSPSSQAVAREFDVGDKDGWVVKPAEDYDHWAQRNRFQVNDTLHFKYKKGSDSVVVVRKEDFDSCNANNPIQRWTTVIQRSYFPTRVSFSS